MQIGRGVVVVVGAAVVVVGATVVVVVGAAVVVVVGAVVVVVVVVGAAVVVVGAAVVVLGAAVVDVAGAAVVVVVVAATQRLLGPLPEQTQPALRQRLGFLSHRPSGQVGLALPWPFLFLFLFLFLRLPSPWACFPFPPSFSFPFPFLLRRRLALAVTSCRLSPAAAASKPRTPRRLVPLPKERTSSSNRVFSTFEPPRMSGRGAHAHALARRSNGSGRRRWVRDSAQARKTLCYGTHRQNDPTTGLEPVATMGWECEVRACRR